MQVIHARRRLELSRGGSWTSSAWTSAAVRVGFGVIWLIDAVLKWRPSFRASFVDQFRGAAQGQPGWLAPWFRWITSLIQPHAALFAYDTAVAETALGVALVLGIARKSIYLGGAAYSLLIWATADGFGGPYSAGATDIGPSIIYAVVFLALFVLNARSESSPHSLDAVIERRWPRWRVVAEAGPQRGRPFDQGARTELQSRQPA